jgi:GT2 family glycosyltransferase
MEEIDLCWRLKGQGFRIVCIPQSEVYHVGGGTLQVEHPHKTYLNFRNNLLMLYKNLPQKSLSNIMRWRMLFDYAAAFQLFVTGKPKNAKSVFKARRDFKKMLPGFVDKRIENLSSATRTDFPEMLRKSIVIEYYLKGNKTYSKLIK